MTLQQPILYIHVDVCLLVVTYVSVMFTYINVCLLVLMYVSIFVLSCQKEIAVGSCGPRNAKQVATCIVAIVIAQTRSSQGRSADWKA
jgi:hypothetical protein